MGSEAVESLPDTFTYSQARAAGVSNRRIYSLRDSGKIEQLGRGLFHRVSDTLFDFAWTTPNR